jgi:hypothetical protein
MSGPPRGNAETRGTGKSLALPGISPRLLADLLVDQPDEILGRSVFVPPVVPMVRRSRVQEKCESIHESKG